VWRFTHPDDMPATIEQLQRLVEGESDAWYLEKRYFHRDGHPIWGRSSTWLVRDRDGRASYVVTQLQDITAQKQLEEQTRRLQAELAHVLRVRTMGEMVAEIAHEINQPLASIANFANGLATRLERDVEDVEALRTAAAQIANEALRASDIIRRLRDFLRRGEVQRECCDANAIVRDALRLIEPELRQDAVALKLQLAPPLHVEVDRVQIAQVVLNLLRNALEAMAAGNGGPREVQVETARGTDSTVVISVRDSGVGLPPAQETRIFDAFFTTKERGLGLGLSISRSIIEAHGGRLWARANHEHGTTVAFVLPLAPQGR
jgi:C4-dicarboxylate-specific signal transduction histidine kinase